MNTQAISRSIAGVEGFLTEDEGATLYELAKHASRLGPIVEIGSWKGRSTICLALGSAHGARAHVYAIDPHTGSPEHHAQYGEVSTFDEFAANLHAAGVEDLVVPLVTTSSEAARAFHDPISMIFIDGAHEYESVKRDFDDWYPKVIDGGVVALHDTVAWPGPRRVARADLLGSRRFRGAGFVHQLTFAEKTQRNSVLDCVRNRYLLALKDLHLMAQTLRFPAPVRTTLGIVGRLVQPSRLHR